MITLWLPAKRRNVFDLAVQGLTNPEIGSALGIASGTAMRHMNEIMADAKNHGIPNRLRLIADYHLGRIQVKPVDRRGVRIDD